MILLWIMLFQQIELLMYYVDWATSTDWLAGVDWATATNPATDIDWAICCWLGSICALDNIYRVSYYC